MKKVGVFEGKTHFSALIDEASRGETIVVTKNGRPVAQIGPVVSADDRAGAMAAMQRLLSGDATLGPAHSVRRLIDEGRRY